MAKAPEGERVLAGLSDPFAAPFVDPMAEMAPFVDPETGRDPAAEADGSVKAVTFAEPANPDKKANPSRRRVPQQGLTLFAGGRISAEGEHLFTPCPGTAEAGLLAPPLRRIAHVMPDLGTLLAPVPQPRDPERLPGTPAESLRETGNGA